MVSDDKSRVVWSEALVSPPRTASILPVLENVQLLLVANLCEIRLNPFGANMIFPDPLEKVENVDRAAIEKRRKDMV